MSTDETELIQALRKGEDYAFRQVYQNYYRMAISIVQNNHGNEQETEDIFQEMLFILVKKLRQEDFQLTAKLGTYIFSILRNLWFKRLKKTEKTRSDIDIGNHEFIDLNDQELEVKKAYEQKHVLMAGVLKNLQEDCRNIILASFYQKLPHEEIAQTMGYTKAFVRVKLHRCMEGFRNKVRAHPDFQSTLT